MSSSDSIDAPADTPPHPEPTAASDIDPAIAEAVDGVANRFGVPGLEQMIAYADDALDDARAALDRLAEVVD
ncbi:hypothetical protein [Nocardioides cynanchi]|uniref:hypothetical protein n=1 Tax=Nocardioides cynanchi TaxID=2558918 RepID=UPI001243EB1A|nr:hypothetical protein [Nocardioides cynanchi]